MSMPDDTSAALSDITNITDEATRRRDEITRRQRDNQRERRARMTEEEREEMKRKQREYQRQYRARKKETSQHTSTSNISTKTVPTSSTIGENGSNIIIQSTPMVPDKENIPPQGVESHILGAAASTTPVSALSVHVTNYNSANAIGKEARQQRKRRADMSDAEREEVNRRQREYQREYRARKRAHSGNNGSTSNVSPIVQSSSIAGTDFGTGLSTILENDVSTECTDWLHKNDSFVPGRRGPPTHRYGPISNSNEPETHTSAVLTQDLHDQENEDEFDRELHEPAHDFSDVEEEAIYEDHGLHTDNINDDDGVIQRHTQGCEYESYHVVPDGQAGNNVPQPDPYDSIYQNLPQRHKLRQVPDCGYCGAMRFQSETPGFCCRKGKVEVHIPEVPEDKIILSYK